MTRTQTATKSWSRRLLGAVALLVAAFLALAALTAKADAAWQSGWPGQPWTEPGAHVTDRGHGAYLVMGVHHGTEKTNVPGVRWDRVLQRPAPGRAWCVRYDTWWNSFTGAVRTVWFRANVWPASHTDPPFPEFDATETLYADQSDAYTHPPLDVFLRDHLVGQWLAPPGQWRTWVWKLGQDRVSGGVRGNEASAPLHWPTQNGGGYAMVAGQWLKYKPYRPDDRYFAVPNDSSTVVDAVQRLRNTQVWECAASGGFPRTPAAEHVPVDDSARGAALR